MAKTHNDGHAKLILAIAAPFFLGCGDDTEPVERPPNDDLMGMDQTACEQCHSPGGPLFELSPVDLDALNNPTMDALLNNECAIIAGMAKGVVTANGDGTAKLTGACVECSACHTGRNLDDACSTPFTDTWTLDTTDPLTLGRLHAEFKILEDQGVQLR